MLRHGEILRSIEIPKPFPDRARFYKIAKRSMDDISTVAAAIAVSGDRMQFGFGGVAPTPVAFTAPRGRTPDLRDHTDRIKPIGDHRGSAEYRLAVAQSLIAKFRAEA